MSIKNPLVNNQCITYADITDTYNIYILANNTNETINSAIYYYTIDKELYDSISKNIILIKASIQLLENKIHFSKAYVVQEYVIQRFNKSNYILNDTKNIILLMLNMPISNIYIYISQFENKNTLINFNKKILINKYFFHKTNYLKDIINLTESNYWTDQYYQINLTQKFNNLQIKKTKILNREGDYLYDSNNKINFDIIHFKINNNNLFTNQDILDILLVLSEKEQYLLICNLIISKNYAYLVLNNYDLLIKYKNIFIKYCQVFRYLIGYAWSIFYLEESTKKSFINKNDKFIFDINTAAELPLYPFLINFPKMNPYMTIFVEDSILSPEQNIGGVINFKSNGIANLNTFINNFNIFCTGNSKNNLFENIDFKNDNIAICGSIICACLQKSHPLLELFNNYKDDEKIKRYFNEYYVNSDIDVIFQTNDNFDFMEKVIKFYNQIVINVCKINSYAEASHIQLYSLKTVYLYINNEDIKNIISENYDALYLMMNYIDNINITNPTIPEYNESNDFENIKKFILGNLHFDKVIILFDKLFNEEIKKYINNYPIEIQNKYCDFFDFSNKILIVKMYTDKIKVYDSKILLSYKYKIKSIFLDHELELFKIIYDDFFATVHKFHLPCVRGYYNGENVYLTPSCITAHLTLTNIDYNYFSGIADPYEIINKYRMRGFGTFLNLKEKNKLENYSKNFPFWKNLYNNNIYGPLNLTNKLFQPRLYNIESYYNSIPVDMDKEYTIVNKKMDYTIKDIIDEINKMYKVNSDINNIFQKLVTIKPNGTIDPIKKWIIDLYYDMNN